MVRVRFDQYSVSLQTEILVTLRQYCHFYWKTGQMPIINRYCSGCWLNVIVSRLFVLNRLFYYMRMFPLICCDLTSKDVANLSRSFRKFPPNIKFQENVQP